MFSHVMAVSAGAFATADSWPQRILQAGRAFSDCIEQNPTLAHVTFAQSHAGGPVAMGRLPELIGAFTIFLHEGYRYSPNEARPKAPSPLALEAIVTAVFELCHVRSRSCAVSQPTSQVHELAFLCLAPFIGAPQAFEFLQGGPEPPAP
jgi:hypothetical protein